MKRALRAGSAGTGAVEITGSIRVSRGHGKRPQQTLLHLAFERSMIWTPSH